MMQRCVAVVGVMLAMAAAGPARALPEDKAARSGLPVPRFATLSAGEANARAGPGAQYPIAWVYRRPGLPLLVLREWGPWRQVRDATGDGGWMLGQLLGGARHVVVVGTVRTLHAQPDAAAPPVWRAQPGVVARVLLCEGAWCRISAQGRAGWILRQHVWGVGAAEIIR